jgi:hypothetical protein
MLLQSENLLPIEVWWRWSDVVYDQMGHVEKAFREFDLMESADFFAVYRGQLKKLWIETQKMSNPEGYRENFVDIYERFLAELPETADVLQELLNEDWRSGVDSSTYNPYKSERAANIFGFPDIDNPRGIADGTPRRGYLTSIMKWMIHNARGINDWGTLKPSGLPITPQNMPVASRAASKSFGLSWRTLKAA